MSVNEIEKASSLSKKELEKRIKIKKYSNPPKNIITGNYTKRNNQRDKQPTDVDFLTIETKRDFNGSGPDICRIKLKLYEENTKYFPLFEVETKQLGVNENSKQMEKALIDLKDTDIKKKFVDFVDSQLKPIGYDIDQGNIIVIHSSGLRKDIYSKKVKLVSENTKKEETLKPDEEKYFKPDQGSYELVAVDKLGRKHYIDTIKI